MKRSKKLSITIIALALMLMAGWVYREWDHHSRMKEKSIRLIYSFAPTDEGYGQFRPKLEEELRQRGFIPRITEFYLDCEVKNERQEVTAMREYLDSIPADDTDLLLVVGDQAAYATLKSDRPLLRTCPTVLTNVHFPNEPLLKKYADAPVYLLADIPDFKSNIRFMQQLFGRTDITVVYNMDLTFLGKRSMQRLLSEVDRKDIILCGRLKSSEVEYHQEILDAAENYGLTFQTALFKKEEKPEKFSVRMFPYRYMAGLFLLVSTRMPEARRYDTAFLLDKWDLSTMSVPHVLNIASFSCIREGFDEDLGIVGGYMATDEISAATVADRAESLWTGKAGETPKRSDLAKEYVLDWSYFSFFRVFKETNIPKGVRIINRPFFDQYQREVYVASGIFVLLFIGLLVALLRVRRKVREEREDMQALRGAHEHLSLSTTGGNISLWYIRRGEINLDESFERLSGIKRRRYPIRQFLGFLYPEDMKHVKQLFRNTRSLQVMAVQRLRFRFDETKGYEWFECRCNSLTDNQGEVVIAGVIQNVQELVEREEELIRAKEIAENAELKQSFLANMSHEIRTPLNAIVGFTNILVGEMAEDLDEEEKNDMIGIVNHNSELLLKLISDVLDISRLDSNRQEFIMERHDLAKIVSEIYRTHQVIIHPPLEFRLEMDDSWTVYVVVDKLRLIQVISNFLSNANKFTTEGSITLGCEADPERNEVRVYVEDTGKGISAEHLNVIFDRFYKADEFAQGTGLGLSICKVIATRLSGRIEARSEVGKGSRFTLILPLAGGEGK